MPNLKQKIVVMGLGYIGLPTASILATKGHYVLGVDINEYAVKTINSGNIHIVEPDLDILVRSAVHSGNLNAALEPAEADTFIVAVPTPFKKTDDNHREPDISYIEAATRKIAPYLRANNLLILESTSPVGTTEFIGKIISEMRPDLHVSPTSDAQDAHVDRIFIAHCPERVLPGKILREIVDNDRIIGGIDKASSGKAMELYRTFCSGNIFITDCRTAELTKLVENSYRDVNIAFANELSIICDTLGVSVWETIHLANKHPRVNILQPGPGVGGHCIAVDPWFLVAAAPSHAKLIRIAREVNDAKPQWVINKIKAKANRFKKPVIGCLGLTFKADIDDLRESPALQITRELIASNIGQIMPCDPNIGNGFSEFPLYELDQVLTFADIVVILVDHKEFKSIDPQLLTEKVTIDTKGIFPKK